MRATLTNLLPTVMRMTLEKPADLEIFLNELQADLEVQRLMTQALFLNMFRTQHDPDLLARIKKEVLGVASRSIADEKMRHFYMLRAERFFQQIEQVLGNIQPRSTPSDAKN